MTVFAVVANSNNEDSRPRMKSLISEKFDETQFLAVGDALWFVDTEFATSKELSNFLSGPSNENGLRSFIVFPVTSYFGLQNKLVWEWLVSKGL